jgi:hypothetical protein
MYTVYHKSQDYRVSGLCPSSGTLGNTIFFCVFRTPDDGQNKKKIVILSVIFHHQNPLESTTNFSILQLVFAPIICLLIKQSMYVYSVYNATLHCLSLPLTQHTTCFGLHGHPQVF